MDLQTFSSKDLVTNPLWPRAGKVPYNNRNVSPRVGLAYSIGNEKPLVVRAGGLFYTRIPQINTSTVATDNGLNSVNLILDNMDYYDRQLFPAYPNAYKRAGSKGCRSSYDEPKVSRLDTRWRQRSQTG